MTAVSTPETPGGFDMNQIFILKEISGLLLLKLITGLLKLPFRGVHLFMETTKVIHLRCISIDFS